MENELHKSSVFTPALSQWENRPNIVFDDLVSAVKNVHHFSYQAAVKAINRYATMRNWLIGFFIVEYQQRGKDRAAYGQKLLKNLEESLQTRGLNVTLFQNSRLFYTCYPQVADLFQIQPMLLAESEKTDEQRSIQPTALVNSVTDGNTLVSKLSFAHITELVHINDKTVRLFYEKECIRCGWSVRELHRFIVTNLHVRLSVSKNPETIINSLPSGNSLQALDIRQPYTFEFLGLSATEVLKEGDIEDALLIHLQ